MVSRNLNWHPKLPIRSPIFAHNAKDKWHNILNLSSISSIPWIPSSWNQMLLKDWSRAHPSSSTTWATIESCIGNVQFWLTSSQCLKITEKKSHSILRAKRAYILSRQKFIKNAKNGEFLKTWSLRSNSATRQVTYNWTKNDGKCQNRKIQIRHFE